MLCDTGAACSCMARAFYEHNLASVTPLRRQRKTLKLVSASGIDLTTIGNVKTNVKLGDALSQSSFVSLRASRKTSY